MATSMPMMASSPSKKRMRGWKVWSMYMRAGTMMVLPRRETSGRLRGMSLLGSGNR